MHNFLDSSIVSNVIYFDGNNLHQYLEQRRMLCNTITDALEFQGTISIGGRTITNLRYANETDGLAGSEQQLVNLD